MKKLIIAVSISLATFSVFATDSDVQKQIDDLRSGLHDVHMNTLQKYSESWGLEDRANIAKLQDTKLDKSVFAVDQARQDKALANSVTKQAAKDCKQTSDLKSYTDKKVSRVDTDRKTGDDVLQGQITTNLSSQVERDAGQDEHINAVQGVAQSANEKADAGVVRMDGIEQRATVTDERSVNNEVRLGEESRTRASQVVQLSAGVTQAQSRADEAFSNAEANTQSIRNTNLRVAEHSAQLTNHEQRIGELEQQTNRKFASLNKHIDSVKKSANAGTSAALASASIPQVTEYQTFALGAGVGGYEGENALAVGFSSRVSEAVVIKASVTTDSQSGFGYNAGFSWGF